jgi:hypothetical protein
MGIITRLAKVGVAVTTTAPVSSIAIINFMFSILLCLNEE